MTNSQPKRARGTTVAAIMFSVVGSSFFLVSGIVGLARSSTAAVWVAPVVLFVLFAVIALVVGLMSRHFDARRVEVESRRPGDITFGAMGGAIAAQLSIVLDGPTGFLGKFGYNFVVVSTSAGIEFWGGNPKNPEMRRRIDWVNVRRVRLGTAQVSRSVPGIELELECDGRTDTVEIALCREGLLAAWAILDPKVVGAAAAAFEEHRLASII